MMEKTEKKLINQNWNRNIVPAASQKSQIPNKK